MPAAIVSRRRRAKSWRRTLQSSAAALPRFPPACRSAATARAGNEKPPAQPSDPVAIAHKQRQPTTPIKYANKESPMVKHFDPSCPKCNQKFHVHHEDL